MDVICGRTQASTSPYRVYAPVSSPWELSNVFRSLYLGYKHIHNDSKPATSDFVSVQHGRRSGWLMAGPKAPAPQLLEHRWWQQAEHLLPKSLSRYNPASDSGTQGHMGTGIASAGGWNLQRPLAPKGDTQWGFPVTCSQLHSKMKMLIPQCMATV